jgi:hypothetical protein
VGSNPIGGAVEACVFIHSARYANRQSGQAQTLVICGFDSLSCQSLGWCSSRRPVKPLPSNCEAVGERFNSFTTHFLSGPVVYWPGHHPLKVEKGVRLPSGLIPNEKANGMWLAGNIPVRTVLSAYCLLFPGVAGVRLALIRPTCPVRYRGLGHCGRAGARPSFISSEAVVRIPGPQIGATRM